MHDQNGPLFSLRIHMDSGPENFYDFNCAFSQVSPHEGKCSLAYELPLHPGPAWLSATFEVADNGGQCLATKVSVGVREYKIAIYLFRRATTCLARRQKVAPKGVINVARRLALVPPRDLPRDAVNVHRDSVVLRAASETFNGCGSAAAKFVRVEIAIVKHHIRHIHFPGSATEKILCKLCTKSIVTCVAAIWIPQRLRPPEPTEYRVIIWPRFHEIDIIPIIAPLAAFGAAVPLLRGRWMSKGVRHALFNRLAGAVPSQPHARLKIVSELCAL